MKERRQAGLTRDQQKDRETHIKRGQESWQRHIHKGEATWNDWMAIGAALLIGRQNAMASAETEQPIPVIISMCCGSASKPAARQP